MSSTDSLRIPESFNNPEWIARLPA